METKVSPLLTCILLLSLLCQVHPKPFDFIQQLQGCQKGDTIKGLHRLKHYLKTFGYLNYHQSNNDIHVDDDTFDDTLELAIKTYQLNYNLKVTGILGSDTMDKMTMTRCGVPDITNGTTSMWSGKAKHDHHHGSSTFRTVSHFRFFSGAQRWPATKTHLTYALMLPKNQIDFLSPVCAQAFGKWASVSHFTFEEIQDYTVADLTIGAYRDDHGDGFPFDGPGGVVAHAFPPTNGRFHYDAEENWASEPIPDYMDLETVALHEIGHLLGLDHSSIEQAIMFPTFPIGARKELHQDDIRGIQALYSIKN